MRLTKFNPETGQYEFHKAAKTQAEYNEQRKAAIQKLGEYEDKASDLAEEIFAEIEKIVHKQYNRSLFGIVTDITPEIAELKKKYTVTDTNDGCKDTKN